MIFSLTIKRLKLKDQLILPFSTTVSCGVIIQQVRGGCWGLGFLVLEKEDFFFVLLYNYLAGIKLQTFNKLLVEERHINNGYVKVARV